MRNPPSIQHIQKLFLHMHSSKSGRQAIRGVPICSGALPAHAPPPLSPDAAINAGRWRLKPVRLAKPDDLQGSQHTLLTSRVSPGATPAAPALWT
ncbi:hypothetical protein GA829_15445 [Mesorhizobium sp. INR15]|nr:hypothetical protein GA829_15445 [Mesorhizobium sp. INR15]